METTKYEVIVSALGWEEYNFATAECLNSGNVDSFSEKSILKVNILR